ncbi:MAG: YeeE/YedE family protein [Rhodospirillales bacterium]|nr:YeeE/YedE family protein [Rhodospirillales bacterium]
MSVFAAVLLGLAMGAAFGIALEKSRVFEPGVILGQMRLANFTMLKVFLTAVITGLVVLSVLHGAGLVKLAPKATLFTADIVGGLLLGAGIALAGACPGTVFAQLGAGYRDARYTFLGALAGAATFIYLEPALAPYISKGGPGKLMFHTLFDLPYVPVALGFAAVLVAGLLALERWRPWRADLGTGYDGVGGSDAAFHPVVDEAPGDRIGAR